MVVREPIADWVRDKMFAGGLTYSGHPLACASGVASIEAFQEEGIVEQSAATGEIFRTELAKLMERHPSIGEVRGLGCFWGLELVKNRETREPLVPFNASGEAAKPMAALMKRALDGGLYLMTHWNVVMCCPPLTITRDELDEALGILDDALTLPTSTALRAFAEAPSAYFDARDKQVVVDPRFHVTVSQNRKWANACRLAFEPPRRGTWSRVHALEPGASCRGVTPHAELAESLRRRLPRPRAAARADVHGPRDGDGAAGGARDRDPPRRELRRLPDAARGHVVRRELDRRGPRAPARRRAALLRDDCDGPPATGSPASTGARSRAPARSCRRAASSSRARRRIPKPAAAAATAR